MFARRCAFEASLNSLPHALHFPPKMGIWRVSTISSVVKALTLYAQPLFLSYSDKLSGMERQRLKHSPNICNFCGSKRRKKNGKLQCPVCSWSRMKFKVAIVLTLLLLFLLIGLSQVIPSPKTPVFSLPRSFASSPPSSPASSTASLDSGLVLHWALNEGSGTTIGDYSGNSQTGTINPDIPLLWANRG